MKQKTVSFVKEISFIRKQTNEWTRNKNTNSHDFLKFQQFIENYRETLGSIEPTLKNYLNTAYEELEWYDKYSPEIFEWLDKTYPSSDYRLPNKIYPESYEIYLKPFLDENNFTFDGEVNINMIVTQSTSSIVLLANDLTIHEIIAFVDAVNIPKVSSYTMNSTNHRFTIYLKSIVPAGSKLALYISYSGLLGDKMVGFYRSSYDDKSGKTRYVHFDLSIELFSATFFKLRERRFFFPQEILIVKLDGQKKVANIFEKIVYWVFSKNLYIFFFF